METVFLTLLNISIKAGWLVLAAVALRFLLRRAPKWLRAALWALVGVRLVCPVSVSSVLSLIPSAETVSPEMLYSAEPSISSGLPFLNAAVNPRLASAVESASGVSSAQTAALAASYIWAAGVVVMLAYLIVSFVRLRRTVAEAVPVDGGLWTCDAVPSPFVLGLVRPRIYLPARTSAEERAYIEAHERAHIRRGDHLIKPIGFLILSVYWFNPLMWAAYILLCRDIELMCDERVLRELGSGAERGYAETLLSFSAPRRAVSACPLAFGEVGVKTRIRNALSYKKPALWITLAALVLCAAAAVCFLTDPWRAPDDNTPLSYLVLADSAAEAKALNVIWYPETEDGSGVIRLGEASGEALAEYLRGAKWSERRALSRGLPSKNSVEFVVKEDYRVTVYASPRVAIVRSGEDTRAYSVRRGDYERALALASVRFTPPAAVYEYASVIYSNPMLSYYPYNGTGLIYCIDGNSFYTVSEETGEIVTEYTDVSWLWETVSKEDWSARFIAGVAPDISGYGELRWLSLGSETALMMADGELWLIQHTDTGAMLRIYELSPQAAD